MGQCSLTLRSLSSSVNAEITQSQSWSQFKQNPPDREYPKYTVQLFPLLLGPLSALDGRVNHIFNNQLC